MVLWAASFLIELREEAGIKVILGSTARRYQIRVLKQNHAEGVDSSVDLGLEPLF